jgi:hypothetical protein
MQIATEVISFLRPTPARTPTAPSPEKIVENTFEQIVEIASGKIPRAKPSRPSGSARRPSTHSRMTVLIVCGALLRVRQNVVRLVDFLEFFFGGRITGVSVWMVLFREVTKSLFDFLFTGRPGNA